MPSLSIVVLLALATYRLTRLVANDSITHPFRGLLYRWAWITLDGTPAQLARLSGDQADWLLDHEDSPVVPRTGWRTWIYELFTCPYCLGVWFATAVYCAWRWGGDVALAIITVAAIAGVQAVIASIVAYVSPEPEDDQ